MSVAVISDIHGNAPALQAVLEELDGLDVERVVCCGDIAAGPLPRETIGLLRDLGERLVAIRGNADREVVAIFDGTDPDTYPPDSAWGGQQVDREDRDWLDALPPTTTLELDGLGRVLFCHATPRDDAEVVIETTPSSRLLQMLAGVEADLVVCGNTHMQFDRRVGPYRVVNVGSVGMPYGQTGAHWLLLDGQVTFRRTNYDLPAAADTIRDHSGWPHAEEFAHENVLSVPTRGQALEFFESIERAT